MRLRSLLVGCLTLVACGGAGSAGDAPVEAFSTGRPCAVATGTCDGGRCVVEIDNRCKTPVTCNLKAEAICKGATGDSGQASATTGKVTQLPGTKKALDVTVDCAGGAPVVTKVQALECL